MQLGRPQGQSEMGFGITRLLGFDLLPRIKQMNKIKLYVPAGGARDAYPCSARRRPGRSAGI